jgi:ribonuclease T2
MRRGDVTVMSISAALAAVAIVAVTYSVRVLDHTPVTVEFAPVDTDSSWLVLTWAPSLCKAEPSSPGCRSGHVADMGATWMLHGLWPQPAANQYCGVPKGLVDRARDLHNADMPAVAISDSVRSSLQSVMSDAAVMASHEWYAHGTCSGVTPDVFFGDAVRLAAQARAVLDPMFVGNRGGRVQLTDIREVFDDEFGIGAGDRVRLSCRSVTGHGSLAYELHLSLPSVERLRGHDGDLRPLKDLLADGPTIGPGCLHASVP